MPTIFKCFDSKVHFLLTIYQAYDRKDMVGNAHPTFQNKIFLHGCAIALHVVTDYFLGDLLVVFEGLLRITLSLGQLARVPFPCKLN